jgi:hypothetical protein
MTTRLAIPLAVVALAGACGPTILTPRLHEGRQAATLKVKNELKVHMRSGELYLLSTFRVIDDSILEGTGTRYTAQRQADGEGTHRFRLDDVAVLETTDKGTVGNLATLGLGALTTVFGTLSLHCLADPKACFGSCPTFYLDDDADRPRAEGFSSSIARALEARDVDALPDARPQEGRLVIRMRNEALETHAVRRVRLLTAPRPRGGRVLAGTDGRFYPASRVVRPASCRGPEGDCLAAIVHEDAGERLSGADPRDLAAREELFLDFDAPPARAGLVLGARQSLVTTFLFYQTLAFMGREAGAWLATMERAGPEGARRLMAMRDALGGIDVAVGDGSGAWKPIGTYDEAGPIAGDVLVLPLPERSAAPLRVRLTMAKGNWRLGYVALAHLGAAVKPAAFDPERVERDGRVDAAALAALRDPDRYLITLAGDEYRLVFPVPLEADDLELFLESQGYYYEWLREEWRGEEDPNMLALIVHRPEEALRRLAAPYKAREAQAEHAFWSSRFRR